MRKFVQPRRRTLSRRIIVRTESKNTSGWKLFFYYHRQKITAWLVVALVIYIAFFYNRSPIQRVTFTQETYQKLEYQEVLTTVTEKLVWKWYFKQKYSNRNELISEVRKQYPLVKTINIISFNEWTLNVDIDYNKPDFIAKTLDNWFWYIYHNQFIPYISGSSLADSWITIWITVSDEWIQNVSWWVFWKIWSQDLVKIINQITFLPKQWMEFVYYPGWEKLKVTSWNGTYIISLDAKVLPETFKKRENLIPYMPTTDPYTADISDPDRITIKQ